MKWLQSFEMSSTVYSKTQCNIAEDWPLKEFYSAGTTLVRWQCWASELGPRWRGWKRSKILDTNSLTVVSSVKFYYKVLIFVTYLRVWGLLIVINGWFIRSKLVIAWKLALWPYLLYIHWKMLLKPCVCVKC
jgi:hypothetical protein